MLIFVHPPPFLVNRNPRAATGARSKNPYRHAHSLPSEQPAMSHFPAVVSAAPSYRYPLGRPISLSEAANDADGRDIQLLNDVSAMSAASRRAHVQHAHVQPHANAQARATAAAAQARAAAYAPPPTRQLPPPAPPLDPSTSTSVLAVLVGQQHGQHRISPTSIPPPPPPSGNSHFASILARQAHAAQLAELAAVEYERAAMDLAVAGSAARAGSLLDSVAGLGDLGGYGGCQSGLGGHQSALSNPTLAIALATARMAPGVPPSLSSPHHSSPTVSPVPTQMSTLTCSRNPTEADDIDAAEAVLSLMGSSRRNSRVGVREWQGGGRANGTAGGDGQSYGGSCPLPGRSGWSMSIAGRSPDLAAGKVREDRFWHVGKAAGSKVKEKTMRKKRKNSAVTTKEEDGVTDGKPKKKKRRGTKDQNKPRRPLSAYNFFFSEERGRILDQLSAEDDGNCLEEGSGESSGSRLPYDGGAQKKQLPLSPLGDKTSSGPSIVDDDVGRRHPQSHGKISFRDLARQIGKRWKALSTEKLKQYKRRAEIDMVRYKTEMEQWTSECEKFRPSNTKKKKNLEGCESP